ncbi:MAG: dipeptidase [Terriglobales bacterium]
MKPLILSCLLVLFSAACALGQNPELARKARQVHNSALVVDTHADTPGRFVDEGYDIARPRGNGHIDLAAIKAGNLGAEFFSVWVNPFKYKANGVHRALAMIDSVHEQVRRHPDQMMMACSVADIRRAHRLRKLAALIGVEGGHAIENDLSILRNYYRLGARYMTLTWMNTNEWADASGDIDKPDVQHHNGLTDFGKQVVLEMNRLGMMVDVSHVADKTFWDVIETTKAPIIASHSSARALTDHYRNMTDEMLRAVAKNGGVVQVNFASFFVDDNFRRAYAAMEAERRAGIKAVDEKYKDADSATRAREHARAEEEWAKKIPRPPLSSLIDHIDHVAKVAGIDHVGLGSDFDGIDSAPEGIDSAADLPKITEMLMARGYSAADMRKILGENLLRVFAEVERVSRQMQGR